MRRRAISRISFFLLLVLLGGGLTPLINPVLVDEAYAENETLLANVYMDVLDGDANIMADPKLEYFTGENMTLQPRFDVSGANVNIKDAYLLVKVPKSEFLYAPHFVDAAPGTGAETDLNYQCEEGFWCIKYKYALLQGGTKGAYPFVLRFKPRVTPNGTKALASVGLYNADGTLVRPNSKAEVTLTGKAGYRFGGYYYGRYHDSGDVTIRVPEGTDKTKVPANYGGFFEANHRISVDPPEGASGDNGIFKTPYKYRVEVDLPTDPATGKVAGYHDPDYYKDCDWQIDLENKKAICEATSSDGNDKMIRLIWRFPGASADVKYDFPSRVYVNSIKNVEAGQPLNKLYENSQWVNYHIQQESSGDVTFWNNNAQSGIYSNGSVYAKNGEEPKMGTGEGQYLPTNNFGISYWHRDYNKLKIYVTELADAINRKYDVDNNRKFPGNNDTGHFYYSYTLHTPEEHKPREAGEGSSNVEAVKTALAGGYDLIGVDIDGAETVIKANVALEEKVIINDTAAKYVKVIARFKEPVALQNSKISATVEKMLTDEELQTWHNAVEKKYNEGNKNRIAKDYNSWTAFAKYYGSDSDGNIDRGENDTPKELSRHSYFNISDTAYEAKLYTGIDNSSIIYSAQPHANERALSINPDWYHDNVLKRDRPVEGLKTITVLPEGMKYVRTSYIDRDDCGSVAEPELVENYRNTGKTAVIYSYPEYKGQNCYVRMVFEPAPRAPEGKHIFKTFMVYTDKDYIYPRNWDLGDDVYDINGNGSVTDRIIRKDNNVTLIMPKNIYVTKKISLDGENWNMYSPPQDLGGDIFYRITLANKFVTDVTNITVFDHLPEPGDFKTVKNSDGEYLKRGANFDSSVFSTPLTGPIEDLELNEVANQKFNFFYSTDSANKEIESSTAVTWKTKDQITDWSKVKYFKAVLKPGQVIAVKEEVSIYTKNRVPADKSMKENTFAWNSAAYSEGGGSYIEGNETRISIIKYKVKASVYEDFTRDGIFNAEETKLSGYKAELVYGDNTDTHSAGDPVLDDQGHALVGTTDDSGEVSFDVFSRGKYQIKFTKKANEAFAPESTKENSRVNYVASVDNTDENVGITRPFTVDPLHQYPVVYGGIYDASKKSRDFVVRKVDQSGKPVKGVEFTLTYKGKAENFEDVAAPAETTKVGATDNDGYVTFSDIPFGMYSLSETKVPAGYTGAEPQTVEISTKPFGTPERGATLPYLKVVNKAFEGSVKIKKVDADNAETTLAGARFGLYPCTGTAPGKECDTYAETPTYKSIETGRDGLVSIDSVTYGKYVLKEIAVPEHYVLSDETRIVDIDTDGKVVDFVANPFNNTLLKAIVKAKKVDNFNNPVKGAKFGLCESYWTCNITAFSDENGIVTFENVPYRDGEYRIKELEAPAGYDKSDKQIEHIRISEDGQVFDYTQNEDDWFVNTLWTGIVQVTSEDDKYNDLPDTQVSLYKCTGTGDNPCDTTEETPYATLTTDSSGRVTFENVPYGKYQLRQDKVKAGYKLLTQDEVNNFVKSGTRNSLGNIDIDRNWTRRYVTLKNKRSVGSISTKVVDDEDNTTILKGDPVKVELRKCELQADGSCTDTDDSPLVATKSPDNDGNITFSEVPLGTYRLVQTSTLSDYNLGKVTEKVVTLSSDDQSETVTAFLNGKKVKTVTILKQGTVDSSGETKKPLNGVRFGLYTTDDLTTPKCQVETGKTVNCKTGSVVDKATADGKAVFENVVYGEYVIKEEQPLVNYNPSIREDNRTITVNDNTDTDLTGTPFINNIITSTVKITKVDADNPKLGLDGVEFGLFECVTPGDNSCTVTANSPKYTATTANGGVAEFNDVVYGDYAVKEIRPLFNYNPSTRTMQVRIRQQGSVIDLGNFDNSIIRGTVQFRKVDADDSTKVLSGVVFELQQNGETKYTATSNNAGVVVFANVVYGDYRLVEKSTLANYILLPQEQLDKQVSKALNVPEATIRVNENGSVVDLGNIANQVIKGNLVAKLVDEETKQPIQGAEFALKQGDKTVKTVKTDADGKVTFKDIPYGDYTLIETKPLYNYIGTKKIANIKIRTNGQTQEIITDPDWFTNRLIKGNLNVDPIKVTGNRTVLTLEEKSKIAYNLRTKNNLPQGSIIKVDDYGNVTIKYPDGHTQTIDHSRTVKHVIPLAITGVNSLVLIYAVIFTIMGMVFMIIAKRRKKHQN